MKKYGWKDPWKMNNTIFVGDVPLSKVNLMSSKEMSDAFGRSRQFWEKRMSQGLVPFYKTAAARIAIITPELSKKYAQMPSM